MGKPFYPGASFVASIVARELQISSEDVMEGIELPGNINPRHIAMWLVRSCSSGSYSFPHLSRQFGLRGHETARSGCYSVARRMDADPAYRDALASLRKLVLTEWEQSAATAQAELQRKDRPDGPPQHQRVTENVRFPDALRRTGNKRTCLRCKQDFLSSHIGNRLCRYCIRENREVAHGMEMAW